MKLCSATLLALCVFQPNVWAFVHPAANKLSQKPTLSVLQSSTYIGDRGEMPMTERASTSTRTNIREPSMYPATRGGELARIGTGTGRAVESVYDVWDSMRPATVQGGGSLKTWSFQTVERAQVLLRTEGRPLEASVQVWAGPDNTPQEMRVYSEDGHRYPFTAAIATPYGYTNTVAVRNIAQMEFPLEACVESDNLSTGLGALTQGLPPKFQSRTIQGGAVMTFPSDPYVERMQVSLETDGRPLNARIELLEGPNSIKQTIELYGEDGLDRPFLTVIETPGPGNTVRIVNTGTVEFPLYANVEPLGRHRGGGGYGNSGYGYGNGYGNGYSGNSVSGYGSRNGYGSGYYGGGYGSNGYGYNGGGYGGGYGYDQGYNGNRGNYGSAGYNYGNWRDQRSGYGGGTGNWYDQSAYRY